MAGLDRPYSTQLRLVLYDYLDPGLSCHYIAYSLKSVLHIHRFKLYIISHPYVTEVLTTAVIWIFLQATSVGDPRTNTDEQFDFPVNYVALCFKAIPYIHEDSPR